MIAPQELVNKFKNFGFSELEVQRQYEINNGQIEFVVQYFQNKLEQQQMDKAIKQSILDQNIELFNPIDKKRKDGLPVGLKNIGNTCYLNCLFQLYFNNQRFLSMILQYKPINLDRPPPFKNNDQQKEFELRQKSQVMVEKLQELFAMMMISNKKYADPSSVVKNIVDENLRPITIGDQKDVGEFNCHFLSRVSDGLIQQQSAPIIGQQSQIISSSAKYQQDFISQQSSQDDLLLTTNKLQRNQLNITNDNISKFFFGKLNSFISYKCGDEQVNNKILQKKNQKQFRKEEQFSFITLSPQYGDFYEAIDKTFIGWIDGFRNPLDEEVRAEKQSFIIDHPFTLFFQIQRVNYNVQES